VVLLEAESDVGGRTWTLREGGFTIDTGASVLFSIYTRTLELIRDLGHGNEVVRCRGVTGFHDGEELHLLRLESPPSYLRLGLLSRRQRARLALRGALISLRPGPGPFDLDSLADADRGETIAAWARRNLGEAGYQYAIRPNVEGLSGFSCEDASAATAIALMRASRGRGIDILALRNGTASICDWLVEGVDVRPGERVLGVEAGGESVAVRTESDRIEATAAVIAADARAAATLLPPGSAREALELTPYAASVHVSLAYEEDPWPRAPADAVIPVGPGEQAAGAVALLSRKSPSLVPAGAQVADVYFGDRAARRLPSDVEALAQARETTRALLGSAPSPLFERVFRRERAVPLPRPGGFARLRTAREAMPPRVRLAGDYLFHQTVEGAIRSGERAARDVSDTVR
jgi:protoporphyrinogen/coproporphyrinogen III oxidase